MKFATIALLFTASTMAQDVQMPFDMNQMATWMKMSALDRYNDYIKVNDAKWKKDAAYDYMNVAAKAAYDATSKIHDAEVVAYAKKVRDAAGYSSLDQAKKDIIDTELWQNQLKMDVQKAMSAKIQETITEELVKENPKIKEQLDKMTFQEKSEFTDTVKDMAGDMIAVQKKKTQNQLVSKAEAKIFDKSDDEQKAFDNAQKQLRNVAAKVAAQEQAKAAAEAAKASTAAILAGKTQLSFAEKLAAMKAENEKKIKEEEEKAAQALADMKKLVDSGFLTKTDDERKADLAKAEEEVVKRVVEQEAKKQAEQKLLAPNVGERAYPCGLKADKTRVECVTGLCCGAGIPTGTAYSDYLNAAGRVEICFDETSTSFTHKQLGKEDKSMIFICITGAKQVVASTIAVLAASYMMA